MTAWWLEMVGVDRRDESIDGHECVWDVDQWICQDCWEAGFNFRWPCAPVKAAS